MMVSRQPGASDQPPPESPPSPLNSTTNLPPRGAAPAPLAPSNFLIGFDWFIGAMVIALGFMISSFAVRNSDFWQHLATGRLIASGEYSFGTDPYSYMTADRTWVNHSWLFDWGMYQAYRSGDGQAVVILKALIIGLVAALIMLCRRSGQSPWPYAVGAMLALLAMAPRLAVQTHIASIFFMTLLLFLLTRDWTRGPSWRLPLAVGIVMALWSNTDQWFIMGPVILIAHLIGNAVRSEEGIPVRSLAIATAVGVVACMVNPHHVRVWQLPVEAFNGEFKELFGEDPELLTLFRGLFDTLKDTTGDLDNPANTIGWITLLLLVAIGSAVNFASFSIARLLATAIALVVAVLHARAVPFFAVTAAVYVGTEFARAGRRWAERPRSEMGLRLMHTGRTVGRSFTGIVLVVLLLLCYPGWLQPLNQGRRLSWEVIPNESLVQSTRRIQSWFDDGKLPADARVLNIQSDFAHYAAWFAPKVKTYFDFRFALHREDWNDYAGLHRRFGTQNEKRSGELLDLNAFMRTHEISFIATAHPSRGANLRVVSALLSERPTATGRQPWPLWSVDGRAAVFGWDRQTRIPRQQFDRMRFDPVREAYRDQPPMETPPIRTPLVNREIWDRYLHAPPESPIQMDQIQILSLFHTAGEQRMARDVPGLAMLAGGPFITIEKGPETDALGLLITRAARQAIIARPDHADSHFMLGQVSGFYEGFNDSTNLIRRLGITRGAARMPDDPAQIRSVLGGWKQLTDLAEFNSSSSLPMRDLAAGYTRKAIRYLEFEIDYGKTDGSNDAEEALEQLRKVRDELKKRLEVGEQHIEQSLDQFTTVAGKVDDPAQRLWLAMRFGLAGEGLKEMRKADYSSKGLPVSVIFASYVDFIQLLIHCGEVEEAVDYLGNFTKGDLPEQMGNPKFIQEYLLARGAIVTAGMRAPPKGGFIPQGEMMPVDRLRQLRSQLAVIIGDYGTAAELQISEGKLVRDQREQWQKRVPAKVNSEFSRLDAGMMAIMQRLLSPWDDAATQMGRAASEMHQNTLRQYLDSVMTEGSYLTRLGLTYLESGEVKKALACFKAVADLPDIGFDYDSRRIARRYRAAIESVAKE